ncbi:uncharacterized protein BJ212DRAFT_1378453, partial [Suillus subaureus]
MFCRANYRAGSTLIQACEAAGAAVPRFLHYDVFLRTHGRMLETAVCVRSRLSILQSSRIYHRHSILCLLELVPRHSRVLCWFMKLGKTVLT